MNEAASKLRAELLRSRPRFKIVDWQGLQVKVVAPSIGLLKRVADIKDEHKRNLEMLIECVREPDTDDKIFQAQDLSVIQEQPLDLEHSSYLFLIRQLTDFITEANTPKNSPAPPKSEPD